MSLSAGTRLGPYEIQAPLGTGGMGEVYRARDPRLDRDVAVKVLPTHLTTDEDRLRRFEQEARAAGALNHPNILAIHDIGTHDGTPYVVSELLEGRTLREQLTDAAVSSRKAVEYAIQLAHGLAAAHEKGIVHRDLKPENIFVTNDGRLKILDFGLAKLTEPVAVAGAPTAFTAPRVNTEPGTVMGTVGYMSPEQVRGQPSDHRSDIFSMGAVLYEMLSGRRLFSGDSSVETMHAILKQDAPALGESGQMVAPGLQRVVDHCLEKIPSQRFQSARDLAFALEALPGSTASGSVIGEGGAVPSARWTRRERVAWAAAGVATLGLVAVTGVLLLRRPAVAAAAIRFLVPLPEKVSLSFGVQSTNLSVSPDGRQLVFVGITDGQAQLWVRPFGQLAARAVPGTEGASSPFWSPDSRYVAFFSGGKLKRIDPTGTSPQTICDLPGEIETAGTWGRDGVILFTVLSSSAQSLFRVDAAGGVATPFVKEGLWWPHFLPDGRHYLAYQISQDPARRGIVVASLDSSDTKVLVQTKMTRPEYGSGFVVYARDGSLLAQRFDVRSLQVSGEAITVVERVPMFENTGWSGFSLSRSGEIAYLTWGDSSHLEWRDRTGLETGQISSPVASDPRISPDGRRVAIVQYDRARLSGEIWIHELARGTATRFALGPTDNGNPVWSPDGKRLAFFSCCQPTSAAQSTLYVKDVGDPGRGMPLMTPGFHSPTDWSSDGRFILFGRYESSNKPGDIWVLSVDDRKAVAWLETPFNESSARFSPDGRWIAYASNETNRDEIYVARFDRPSERARVSIDGGRSPRWRRDGKELFFLGADNRVMAASVKGRDILEFDASVALFRSDAPVSIGWDADPGGQRFIVGSAASATPFGVVVNWTADLK